MRKRWQAGAGTERLQEVVGRREVVVGMPPFRKRWQEAGGKGPAARMQGWWDVRDGRQGVGRSAGARCKW
jgi:hypothetical protein